MFEPQSSPRVFGVPPGADFPRAVRDGVLHLMQTSRPEELARVEIFVNTRRMQRRLKSLFDHGPALLLPRIRLVTDLSTDVGFQDIPPPASALRRRLELTQLIGKLLDQQPDLAPRAALFDLADSLAALMDEMQGEAVSPQTIRNLDVSDSSGHWQRSLQVVALVEQFFGAESGQDPDIEARQRLVVDRLQDHWAKEPPGHPILVAGSTGSRGATGEFMRAVAALPQGALVLPGVDFDMPEPVWDSLDHALSAEDHPQYRFARLARSLKMHPAHIALWPSATPPANPARNRLVSLALRPAPVTDQWLTEGKDLTGITQATAEMTLIEAPSSRAEASAIAVILRNAVESGKVAALITPDRMLTRQVTAALDRWNLIPDDSAGRPLPLSPPGRFLRQVAGLFGEKLNSEQLLALLKHPITNSGSDERGPHLLFTRELELKLRRYGPPFPTAADLIGWAGADQPDRQAWAHWLATLVFDLQDIPARPLSNHLDQHIALASALAAGPTGSDTGELWLKAAGKEALRWVNELRREAKHGGTLSTRDYQALFQGVLQRGEVRDAATPHPDIMIWGTLEARVQGADLVILGGLNEGVWPEPPKPDPWLNRQMRHDAGLLLPERQIGLSAHDFQQAIAAKEVVLTRAIRDAESQTVPSRWLNRLGNLLNGVSEQSTRALSDMKARGARILRIAQMLDHPETPVAPAQRPSPRPPIAARPREITVTEVQTLIRDPYAVYARRILGLQPLDPLRQEPDAPTRGIVMHKIMERFLRHADLTDPKTARETLLQIARTTLDEQVAWPAARRIWRVKLEKIADELVAGELSRNAQAAPLAQERSGAFYIADLETSLRGKIDRIDQFPNGALRIIDYKTGTPPTRDQQTHFDKQLPLSALLAERGALDGIAANPVADIGYIGLGTSAKFDPITLEYGQVDIVLAELTRLLASYLTETRGYTSRRAVSLRGYDAAYDHLARYGEWDESFDPTPMDVGK